MKKEDRCIQFRKMPRCGCYHGRHKQSPSTDLRATTIAESAEDSEESSVVGVKDAAGEKVQEPKETALSEESEKAEPTEQPSQDDTVDGMDTTEAAEAQTRRDYKRDEAVAVHRPDRTQRTRRNKGRGRSKQTRRRSETVSELLKSVETPGTNHRS
jgi:hypothetical protein